MALSKLEQETIINFNEAETAAIVCTHNGRIRRRLEQLERDRPCEVSRDYNGDFLIPKGWVRINPPREYSESARAIFTDSLKAANTAKIVQTSADLTR